MDENTDHWIDKGSQKMRIGVICNDKWHPAALVQQGLESIGAGLDFEFVLETTEQSTITFDRFDAILLTKANCRSVDDPRPWLTGDVQQDFVDFVEGGRGLLVVHSGTVGYAEERVFRSLVGGVFMHHPEQCDVTVEVTGKSDVSGPDYPLFTARDEHYFMELYSRDLTVFMTSTSVNGIQPAGWTRQQGNGRVCVLTPGHNVDVWLNPVYGQTLARAIDWCARGDQRK